MPRSANVFRRIKKPIPLRVSLTLLVLVCWVLPVAAAGGAGLLYVTVAIRDRVERSVTAEVEYAAQAVMTQFDAAVELSRDVSRYTALYDVLNGQDGRKWIGVRDALASVYQRHDVVLLAGVFLWEDPDQLFYIEGKEKGTGAHYLQNAHEKTRRVSQTLDSRIGFIIEDDDIYLIRNLLDRSDYHPFGTLVLSLDPERLLGSLYHMEWEPSVMYHLGDQTGMIRAEKATALEQISIPEGQAYRTGRAFLYRSSWLKPDYAFDLTLEIPLRSAFPELRLLTVIEAVLLAVIIPVLAIVLIFFQKTVSRPVRDLLYTARRLKMGELGTQTAVVRSSKEFSYLAQAINEMSGELERLFAKVYKEELAHKDAKIMALTSQINPHFLNNTLELMNWQARMSGADEISEMIGALSVLMDAALNRSDIREVTLAEELSFAEAYLLIISKRFSNRLRVTQRVDDSLKSVKMPPLIIQPLMENAITHGLDKNRTGEMKLSVYREEDSLVIELYNSGELTPEDERKVHGLLFRENGTESYGAQGRLGLKNVQERLYLLYGDQGRLTLSRHGTGTMVRIRIPIHTAEV